MDPLAEYGPAHVTLTPASRRHARLIDLRRLAAQGYTKPQAARELGVTHQAVYQLAAAHGIAFTTGRMGRPPRATSA